jgi:hypothetical protein
VRTQVISEDTSRAGAMAAPFIGFMMGVLAEICIALIVVVAGYKM